MYLFILRMFTTIVSLVLVNAVCPIVHCNVVFLKINFCDEIIILRLEGGTAGWGEVKSHAQMNGERTTIKTL